MLHRREFKNIEVAFVGHGEIDSDLEPFTLPNNCCLITYSPDNYTLSNSAIELIASERSAAEFKSIEDVRTFVEKVKCKLSNAEVKMSPPNSVVLSHTLHQLSGRSALGNEEQRKQYKESIRLLMSKKVYIQDAQSSIFKYNSNARENMIDPNASSISLENAIKPRVAEAADHDQFVIIHWLCCRRDMKYEKEVEITRYEELSRTPRSTPNPRFRPY